MYYYRIENITCGNNGVAVYKLEYVNKFYEKLQFPYSSNIQSDDPNIQPIASYLQEKFMTFLKFVDRYNLTINYLNKKAVVAYNPIENADLETSMNYLIIRCKLNLNQLDKIEYTLKKTKNHSFQIHLMIRNPFGFITEEMQLITFDKAEKIANEFNLEIDFKTKCEKWTYCLFNDEKTFYI